MNRRNWRFGPHAIARVVVRSVHEMPVHKMPSLVLAPANETWLTGISYKLLGVCGRDYHFGPHAIARVVVS